MSVIATHKDAAISAQKVRVIARQFTKTKGKSPLVSDVIEQLQFMPQKGARLLLKVVKSAMANAEHNTGADIDELRIETICIDEAPTLKRFQARAKGRGNRILKRRCHISVSVAESSV